MIGSSPMGQGRGRTPARRISLARATPALALLVASAAAAAAGPEGIWATPNDQARIRIQSCPEGLCGDIVWLRDPFDEQGRPKRDRHNEDEAQRERPILGLPMLRGFRAAGPERWGNGRIYNPEDGRTYRAELHLGAADLLSVSGCVLIFCKAQEWRRVD